MRSIHLRRLAVWLPVLLLLMLPLLSIADGGTTGLPSEGSQIGQTARESADKYAGKAVPGSEDAAEQSVTGLFLTVGLLLLVAFVLVSLLFTYVARLTGFAPFKHVKSNVINPRLMLAFLILSGIALWIQHSAYAKFVLLGDAASEHGVDLDRMMTTTIIITFIVFVITQVLLFVFAYLFRSRPGNTGSYYHDNTRLELIWTLLPAVVLSYLVLDGVSVWQKIHSPGTGKTLEVELVAEQFQWNIRHAGQDGKLGSANYKLIGGENNLGLDWKDTMTHDDIYVHDKVLIVPVDQPVLVKIRAKDVLHGVYMPHFRVQMYAVPGMPTQFQFTPKITTAQARKEANNPEFNYELACSQLCGSGHYNMRVVIEVVSREEYDKWRAGIKPMYAQLRERGVILDQPATTKGTTDDNDRPDGAGAAAPAPLEVTPGGTRPATIR